VQARVLGLNARDIYGLPACEEGPAGVVADYFAAVTAQDPDMLRGLFAPDAVFDVDGEHRTGLDSILGYYVERTFRFADFRPDPGPLTLDGSSVTVDIDVHIGGTDSSVQDVFEIDDGRIAALRVRGFTDALRAVRA
jgi:ketosteroid isomerase-like protein